MTTSSNPASVKLRFTKVGVRYCLAHQGVANEDDDVCDFARGGTLDGERGRCDFRVLGYQRQERERTRRPAPPYPTCAHGLPVLPKSSGYVCGECLREAMS